MAHVRDMAEFESILNCPICQDVLNDPRNLECGHTFCLTCLARWYKQRQGASSGKIRCPNCNSMTALPDKDVAKLPRAYALHDVVDQVERLFRQASVGTECQLCTNKTSGVVEANVYCSSCDKVFCDKCQDRHRARFSSHSIVRLCDVTEKFLGCPVHTQETLKHFCTTCTTLICTLCALDDKPNAEHLNHAIVSIAEAPKYCGEKLKEGRPCLDQELAKKKALLEETRSVLNQINKQSGEVADSIHFMADDLISAVQQWEERALARLEDKKKECAKHWQLIENKMEQDGAGIEQQRDIINLVESGTVESLSVKDYVNTLKNVNKQREESKQLGMQMSGPVIRKQNIPNIAADLTAALQKCSTFSVEHCMRKVQMKRNVSDYDDVVIVYKPKAIWSVSKYGNKDNELRSPVGVSFTLVNDILICEVENQRVSLYSYVGNGDTTGQFIRKLVISGVTPKDAVSDEDGVIYVADASTNTVVIFDRQGRRTSSWQKGLFGNPRCLALMSNNRLVVGDKGKYCVNIFKRDGTLLQKFGCQGDGDTQFQFIISIATDSRDRIIVADRELNCIKIFDENGQFLFRIQPMADDGYCKPRYSIELAGVATDKNDNIFITIHGTHQILKYTSDGQLTLPSPILGSGDKIKFPCAVSVGSDGFMAVTESSALHKHSAIRVFKF